MDQDEYLTAYFEQLKANPALFEQHKARRSQDTQQFFADKPLEPLTKFMADKGWVSLIQASSLSSTQL